MFQSPPLLILSRRFRIGSYHRRRQDFVIPRCKSSIVSSASASESATASSVTTAMSTSSPTHKNVDNDVDNNNKKSTIMSAKISFNHEEIRNEIISQWSTNETSTRWYWCIPPKSEYLKPSAKWYWLDSELSSNLAGETGAVNIYRGALCALEWKAWRAKRQHDQVLQFCQEHMKNEENHLEQFQAILPQGKYTTLLPLWRMAGFTLGFLPTFLGGGRALYVTVHAVETFVEKHFQQQIAPLKESNSCPNLVELLEYCCEDEVHHREDAARCLLNNGEHGEEILEKVWVKTWQAIVKGGSAAAAEIARRI